MPGYILDVRKSAIELGFYPELSPGLRNGRMIASPVECTYPNGQRGPMVPGTIASMKGIPKQTYGMRFVQSPIGETAVDGTTLGIHGRNSHYKNKDKGMAQLLVGLMHVHHDYQRGMRGAQLEARERQLTTFTFHAPCNDDGTWSRDNKYHKWGRWRIRKLLSNSQNWHLPPPGKRQAEYSQREFAPFCRWVQVIRVDDKPHEFFCVGQCFVRDADRGGDWVKLQPVNSGAAMPAANLAVLAQVANQVFNHMRTPPPAIVQWVLGSPAPVRGHSAPALIGGPGLNAPDEVARPTAVRAGELEVGSSAAHAAAGAMADLAIGNNGADAVDDESDAEEGEINEDGTEKTVSQLADELAAAPVVRPSAPAPLVEMPALDTTRSNKATGKQKRPGSPYKHVGDDSDEETGLSQEPPRKRAA